MITNESHIIVQVPVVDDNVTEGDETFTVHLMLLSQPESIQIEMNITEASVTIRDDDSKLSEHHFHTQTAILLATPLCSTCSASYKHCSTISHDKPYTERLHYHYRHLSWTERNPQPRQ